MNTIVKQIGVAVAATVISVMAMEWMRKTKSTPQPVTDNKSNNKWFGGLW